MYLHLHPEGTSLTEAQARTVDDEFFLARPLPHFASRIAMLLEAEGGRAPLRADHPEFFDALGLSDESGVLEFDERERGLQLAVDALALRHQAAEALTRVMCAVAHQDPGTGMRDRSGLPLRIVRRNSCMRRRRRHSQLILKSRFFLVTSTRREWP